MPARKALQYNQYILIGGGVVFVVVVVLLLSVFGKFIRTAAYAPGLSHLPPTSPIK